MRPTTEDYAIVRFGAFEADIRNFELRKFGVRVRLREQPFRILVLLMRRGGRTVSREELREELWSGGTPADFDRGIDTAMQELRCALSDSVLSPRYVKTVPGRGYRLIAPVQSAGRRPNQDILNRSLSGLAGIRTNVAELFRNGLGQARIQESAAGWQKKPNPGIWP